MRESREEITQFDDVKAKGQEIEETDNEINYVAGGLREKFDSLREMLDIELRNIAHEIGPEAEHASQLYEGDPVEILRAELASLKYSFLSKIKEMQVVALGRAENAPRAEVTAGSKCSKCGADIDGVSNFCTSCGATFLTEEMVGDYQLLENRFPDSYKILDEIDNLETELNDLGEIKEEDVEKNSDVGSFLVYCENLGLSEEDLQDKSILDVGAGNRKFAGHCIRNDITKDVHSLEPNIQLYNSNRDKAYLNKVLKSKERALLDKNTVKALAESMPFSDDSFDLVVINAGGSFVRDGVVHSTNEINEIYRVLKVGGEFRCNAHLLDASILDEKTVDKELLEDAKKVQKKQDEMIDRLLETGKVIVQTIGTSTNESNGVRYIWGTIIMRKIA